MEYYTAVETLNEVVAKLELSKINILDHLNNNEPIIYLCGKSSSGKTTFLSALFNFDKNELFTSTNISTKTEFRFLYGNTNSYLISGGNKTELPANLIDRKELFKNINNEGVNCTILLNKEALNGRIIVDIPGVFDYTDNDLFTENLINEADVVYFFTPCLKKISSEEFELLKKISKAKIPIIVLFTMGDYTEPDEGITRKTIPDYVQKRMESCFNGIEVFHHQIISSFDFYKGKEEHGIDKIQSHIKLNEFKYKEIAKLGRLHRSVNHYINIIETQIAELENDDKNFVRIITRQNELSLEIKKSNLKDETTKEIRELTTELEWFEKTCNDTVWGEKYNKVYSDQVQSTKVQKDNFDTNWELFWNKNNTANIKFPIINYSEDVFEHVSIDKKKWEELLLRFTKKESKNEENEDNSKKDKPKNNPISLSDIIDLGINIANANIIYKKWNFINQVKSIIKDNKTILISHIEKTETKKEEEIVLEKENQFKNSLEDNIAGKKLIEYKKQLNLLKEIKHGI